MGSTGPEGHVATTQGLASLGSHSSGRENGSQKEIKVYGGTVHDGTLITGVGVPDPGRGGGVRSPPPPTRRVPDSKGLGKDQGGRGSWGRSVVLVSRLGRSFCESLFGVPALTQREIRSQRDRETSTVIRTTTRVLRHGRLSGLEGPRFVSPTTPGDPSGCVRTMVSVSTTTYTPIFLGKDEAVTTPLLFDRQQPGTDLCVSEVVELPGHVSPSLRLVPMKFLSVLIPVTYQTP